MFEILDGRKSFYQWDLNQSLIVEDGDITEVHFCNKTDDCSLVCETYTKDGVLLVDVPNILLQDNWSIKVYAWSKNHTKYDATFKVVPRSKPSDYAYTETEILTYQTMQEHLENMVIDVEGHIYEAEQRAMDYTEDYGMSVYNDAVMEARGMDYMQEQYLTDYIHTNTANALKGNAFGAVVGFKDVSLFPHKMNVKAESKNKYYNSKDINRTFNGITATGTKGASEIILNGTATSAAGSDINTIILTPGTYTISILGLNDTDKVNVQNKDTGKVVASSATVSTSKTFTIDTEATIGIITVIATGSSYTEQVVQIQIEKGLTATGYTPYKADVSNVGIKRCGKNLFNSTFEIGGIAGGNGNNYNNPAQIRSDFIELPKATYILSAVTSEYIISTVALYDKNKTFISLIGNQPMDTSKGRFIKVRIARADGADMTEEDLVKVKSAFQLEVGNAATEYEAPIAPVEYKPGTKYIPALYPSTTLMPTVDGVVLDVEYNRDINKAYAELQQAIISLGGNV